MSALTISETPSANKPSIGEMLVDTRLLMQRLLLVEEGQDILYPSLSAVVGRPVQSSARSNLDSALRMLRRDGVYFECIRGEGLRRIPPQNVPQIVSSKTTTRIHRAARRGLKDLNGIEYTALPQEAQTQYNVGISLLSTFTTLSSEKAQRILTAETQQKLEQLSHKETLALFSK